MRLCELVEDRPPGWVGQWTGRTLFLVSVEPSVSGSTCIGKVCVVGLFLSLPVRGKHFVGLFGFRHGRSIRVVAPSPGRCFVVDACCSGAGVEAFGFVDLAMNLHRLRVCADSRGWRSSSVDVGVNACRPVAAAHLANRLGSSSSVGLGVG